MARIVCEMHERQLLNPAVKLQSNASQRSLDHTSAVSSLASDSETRDDPVVGMCRFTNFLELNKTRNQHLM